MIFFGEESLRRALLEYQEHYHGERNHQGKGNVILLPSAAQSSADGPMGRRDRLGGPLKYYYREAG